MTDLRKSMNDFTDAANRLHEAAGRVRKFLAKREPAQWQPIKTAHPQGQRSKMTVIVGLEGTLARHEWRLPLRESDGWDAYYAAAAKDAPNGPVVQLVNALHYKGQEIVCFTTMPEPWRGMMHKWLAMNGVMVHELRMRHSHDWRSEADLRAEFIERITIRGVLLAIEESDKVCDAYRAAGITVLQVFNPNGAP